MVKPVVVIAIVTAVCGGAARSQQSDVPPHSGPTGVIRGSVVAAPACPGPAHIDRTDCIARPIQTKVSIYVVSADAVGANAIPLTTIATDGRGQFRFELPPGSYRLVPDVTNGISRGKPIDITITAGATADVQLSIDSGLR